MTDVSVITPVHDEGPLLHETLASVLTSADRCQAALALEIVLVADHVTDDATQSALDYVIEQSDPRVRVVSNAGSPGPGAARNVGIRAATGRWIAFLDADDLWVNHTLGLRWHTLQQFPDAVWLGTDFIHWHGGDAAPARGSLEANRGTRELLGRAFDTREPTLLQKPMRQFLQYLLCWTGATMVRRDALASVGLFDESLRRAQDTHLWYRLAATCDYLFLPQPTALYRQRPSTQQRRGTSLRGFHNIALRKLLSDPSMSGHHPQIRRRLARTLVQEAAHLRSERQFRLALMAAGEAVLRQPRDVRAWKQLIASMVGAT